MANEILPLRRTKDDRLKRLKGVKDGRPRPVIPVGNQVQRVGPTIDRSLSNILDRDDIKLADDPSALAPERALVLEVIGSPGVFVNAAAKIGLEWLAEDVTTLRGVRSYFDPSTGDEDDDEEDETPEGDGDLTDGDFDFLLDDDVASTDETGGALYLGMPTKATFEALRRLWETYKAKKPAPDGFGDWWKLFGLLHEIRSWGPQDRIGEAALRRLKEERARQQGDDLRVEVDLWYRGDAAQRDRAVIGFRAVVKEAKRLNLGRAASGRHPLPCSARAPAGLRPRRDRGAHGAACAGRRHHGDPAAERLPLYNRRALAVRDGGCGGRRRSADARINRCAPRRLAGREPRQAP